MIGNQKGALFPWAPVAFAVGIGWYFSLGTEPSGGRLAALLVSGALAGGFAVWAGRRGSPGVVLGPLIWAVALVALGLGWAGWRAREVAGPVIGWRYYGPIEGRIAVADRSASGAVRLTLDEVRLRDVAPTRTPGRVRVSLHGPGPFVDPVPGTPVMLTGHLAPPGGPVEPGGFDFRRMAWFQGLGAVGYTRSPVLARGPPGGLGPGLAVERLRARMSAYVRTAMPGERGAFAAAIVVGDRSGLDEEVRTALRRSNLAHLLAISGLHMGLLTGFVFAVIRAGLALWPRAALTWPIKQVAAMVALTAGAGYYAISGGNVATERAFIMVAVILGAVLLGRRALTLRAVAVAALIVLVLRPEALTGPGFQMSFAATVALVAVFGALRGREMAWMPRWLKPVMTVVISSAVAGLATAPIAAAHFNLIPHLGLLANVLAVPVMGIVVVPAAVLAGLLWLVAGDGLGFWIMGLGLDWILAVARGVAGIDGAVRHVVTPDATVLPLVALGGLTLALWQGRGRATGLAPLAIAAWLWAGTERPALLISEDGRLLGRLTEAGRALSRERGSAFVAGIWLENDGWPVDQEVAGRRAGIRRNGALAATDLPDLRVLQVSGSAALDGLPPCGGADLLVVTVWSDVPQSGPDCEVYGPRRLQQTGALAFFVEADVPRLVTARDRSGNRYWNTESLRDRLLGPGTGNTRLALER